MVKSVTVLTKGETWVKGNVLSKTVWLNILAIALMVLEAKEVINILPPGAMPYVTAALAVLNIIVRQFTHSPITNSPGEKAVD